ncbi:putative RNA polymerase II subunit B1 CTD phosphatase RPAP2 homolog [Ochlerotatus camptorhynchus]|uniref:putative RNA polymerase II subunit B1 CTD phosphatase RPAP2 homolog n=1 Tax=Ochlerotatus camptorhynchus TaxID=644619 RepID=UPI0031E120F7
MFDEENISVFRDEEAVKEKQKVNRAKLPRKARNFSKEQLQLALRKKKECNSKAQKIVETLLEPVDDVDKFLLMLKDINQCHFEDVVQERAIQKICGYPLCQNVLSNVPQQKYVISLSNKKVYDITERKNFCSGDCFKASNFIKEQMLTSPLWLRAQEDIPEFKLLNSTPQTVQVQKVTKIEITQHPTVVGIDVDKLQIVERTYSEHSLESSKGSQSSANIYEGSEINLSIKEMETEETPSVDSVKDSLTECLGKMSLKDK